MMSPTKCLCTIIFAEISQFFVQQLLSPTEKEHIFPRRNQQKPSPNGLRCRLNSVRRRRRSSPHRSSGQWDLRYLQPWCPGEDSISMGLWWFMHVHPFKYAISMYFNVFHRFWPLKWWHGNSSNFKQPTKLRVPLARWTHNEPLIRLLHHLILGRLGRN